MGKVRDALAWLKPHMTSGGPDLLLRGLLAFAA